MPPIPVGPFSMPMYKEWFPRKLRPWCYVVMLVIFQLTGGVYLGNVSHMVGEWSLMREDVMYIGLCNVVGVNMPFPFLFKFKFRFANKHLLMNASVIMIICNLVCMHEHSVPVLCLLSFLEGFFKLCATFECAGNIQLWMTPKRDFSVFFPLLYIAVVGDISLQSWLAVHVGYAYDSWQMMHWLVIGLLTCCLLFQYVCLKPFYIMRIPWRSIDWLGLVLWSLLFCAVVWLFTYGEYYNWFDGKTFRDGCVITLILLLLTIGRMWNIRHPYISFEPFKVKALYPLMGMFFVGEWLNSTPKALGNVYVQGVMGWGAMTASVLDLVCLTGTVSACLLTLLWFRRGGSYTRLLTLGFVALLAYQVMMYFLITPQTNLEALYLPMFLRGFGYAIFFTACTIHLEELLTFQAFFMGLTLSGISRNGPLESLISGIYEFFLRRQEADALAGGRLMDTSTVTQIALKELFGMTCLVGVAVLLLMLLYDVQPVRSTMKKMPTWLNVGKRLRRQERHNENMRRKAR